MKGVFREPSRPVGILNTMGPAAGAHFINSFVSACELLKQQHRDSLAPQAMPEHWLAQVPALHLPSVAGGGGALPLDEVKQALRSLAAIGVRATAVAGDMPQDWYGELQDVHPAMELLHSTKETVCELAIEGVPSVVLITAPDVLRKGAFTVAFERAGIRCHAPTTDEQQVLLEGMAKASSARRWTTTNNCIEREIDRIASRYGVSTVVVALGGLPVGLRHLHRHAQIRMVDPVQVLVGALAERAFAYTAELA